MPARREAAVPSQGFDQRGRPATADEQLTMEMHTQNSRGVEELLTTAGGSVDGRVDGIPFLALAANHGRVDVIQILIERGVNLEASAPRDVFNKVGNIVVKQGGRPLHAAVQGGQLASLGVLLEAGADPNGTDSEGVTPLMAASWLGKAGKVRCSLVRALLEGGACPTLASGDGSLALHYAARADDTHVVGILLHSSPSSLNIADSGGRTALFKAAMLRNCKAVSYLLSAGASEETTYAQTGQSALLCAIQKDYKNVISLLLENGMKAAGGISAMPGALVVAIGLGRAAILQMLLAVHTGAGIDEGYPAHQTLVCGGLRALHYAAACGSLSSVHVLLAAGADDTALSWGGHRAAYAFGHCTEGDGDSTRKAAMGRMLQRGPAFRASSWTWLAPVNSTSRGVSARPKTELPLGARIYRPKGKPVFTTRFAR